MGVIGAMAPVSFSSTYSVWRTVAFASLCAFSNAAMACLLLCRASSCARTSASACAALGWRATNHTTNSTAATITMVASPIINVCSFTLHSPLP